MSHVTKLAGVVITDIGAVRAAVNELNSLGINVEIGENQKPRVHGYDSVAVCDYVLKLSGAYDVGLKKNAQGNYEPVLDVYQHHVAKAGLGATCPMPGSASYMSQEATQHEIGRFLSLYAKHAALNAAASAGHTVENIYTDEVGNIQIVLAVA